MLYNETVNYGTLATACPVKKTALFLNRVAGTSGRSDTCNPFLPYLIIWCWRYAPEVKIPLHSPCPYADMDDYYYKKTLFAKVDLEVGTTPSKLKMHNG